MKFTPYSSYTIQSINNCDELLNDILQADFEISPRIVDKQVILYGAGSLGKMAKDFFNYLEIPFLYVVDKNAIQCQNDENWCNVQIIHPDEVNSSDKKKSLLIICLVTAPLIALRNELNADGWVDIAFFYDVCETYSDRYPLNNGWFLKELEKDERDAVIKVYSALDSISRMHYLQFIAWRKLRVELLFNSIQIILNNRFFIPEIVTALNDNEVIVDCGAHVGEVTRTFIEITKNRYNKIYAIEADKENFVKLKNSLKNIPYTTFINCALSNKNGKGGFYQGFDFASKLDESGNDIIELTTLDSLNIDASFIKMHLEGGELDALKGALNTIKKHRPIMAITIYHNSEGVWEIPVYLINLLKGYFFYIRLHSWAGTGAVIYAIPVERFENNRK